MSDFVGSIVDQYRIDEKIGAGRISVVYRGYDLKQDRVIALKLFTRIDPSLIHLFKQEARALEALTHPNMTDILGSGVVDGTPYLVMEFVRGETLGALLGQPIPYREAARMLVPIARALAYAHGHHIIHRDVKPANILRAEGGGMLLTDFGLVKLMGVDQANLTQLASGIGTPEYMAPEQAQGMEIDRRVDIYALGMVFYQMLTGKIPFQSDTSKAVLWKQVTEPLPLPGEFVSGLPDYVQEVVFRALKKRPEDRYQEMSDFVSALEAIIELDEEQMDDAVSARRQAAVITDVTHDLRPTLTLADNASGEASIPAETQTASANLKNTKRIKNWMIFLAAGALLMLVIICGMAIFVWGLLDFVAEFFESAVHVNAPGWLAPAPTETITPEPSLAILLDTWLCVEQAAPELIELARDMPRIDCGVFDHHLG
ncbi:MAG: serine/threonine protein kinase [Anaerolineaceae bacterium]|nr:serine/threonine protein kinase [Anaerolineaceae bacterium]